MTPRRAFEVHAIFATSPDHHHCHGAPQCVVEGYHFVTMQEPARGCSNSLISFSWLLQVMRLQGLLDKELALVVWQCQRRNCCALFGVLSSSLFIVSAFLSISVVLFYDKVEGKVKAREFRLAMTTIQRRPYRHKSKNDTSSSHLHSWNQR